MKGGHGQKKTPQGFLATIYLLCQMQHKKSNDRKPTYPPFTHVNRKTKEDLHL